MPLYTNVGYVPALMSGVPFAVWENELAKLLQQLYPSRQVALPPLRQASMLSVDGQFDGDPGAFEVDVQVAVVDLDANYQTIASGNITTVDAANFTFHMDVLTCALFARLLMRSLENNVNVTAYLTR